MTRKTDFDKDEVIAKAMNVFWEKGYEGTSLNDLIQATGLLKGSLYNTFKSKENIFLLCLEKYSVQSKSFFYVSGDPKVYLKNFFNRLVDEGATPSFRKGCLIMNSCLELSKSKSTIAERSQQLFSDIESNMQNVVNQISKAASKEKKALTSNLVTAAFSIREISKFKKDKIFLKQIANNALKDLNISI